MTGNENKNEKDGEDEEVLIGSSDSDGTERFVTHDIHDFSKFAKQCDRVDFFTGFLRIFFHFFMSIRFARSHISASFR